MSASLGRLGGVGAVVAAAVLLLWWAAPHPASAQDDGAGGIAEAQEAAAEETSGEAEETAAGGAMGRVAEEFASSLVDLPQNLSAHILITCLSLGIGIAVSIPLAIVAARKRGFGWPTLATASIIQTIPSIAMLALIYAVVSLVSVALERQVPVEPGSELTRAVGGIPAPSFLTTILALTLYSILPVLRNTATAISEVDRSVTEAARGVGMKPMQVLFKVELPLALPVIIAGIRTSTVWVVGIATLAQPVGQRCLGDFIFTGLQLEQWGMVLLGCVAAALLAIVLDMLIATLQRAAERRSRGLAIAGAIGLLVVIGGGLAADRIVPAPDHYVGAKTFQEQFILASLIAERLEDAGFDTGERRGLGSTIAFQQCVNSHVDCYVDYTGTIWAVQMKEEETADPDVVYQRVKSWAAERHGITCVGRLGFENAYALAMRRGQAERLGIETIEDLAAHAPELTIGGDYEFFGRPEWEKIRDTYGLAFAGDRMRKFQSTLMYKALVGGEVDVIGAFSTDGRIAAHDLVVLEDPQNAIPPYDAIMLVSPEATKLPGFIEALEPLVGAIDGEMMRRANYMVDRKDEQKKSPAKAAQWLEEAMKGGADE